MRLGDMDLIIEVEEDFTCYGDECKFGGGKVRYRLVYPAYSVYSTWKLYGHCRANSSQNLGVFLVIASELTGDVGIDSLI